MEKIRKVALAGCSDPMEEGRQAEIELIRKYLETEGCSVAVSPCLFEAESKAGGREKAEILNGFFRDPEMDAVFDVTGGDLANTVLTYLDYEAIQNSRALFFGYSDLSVVLNAVTAKTGKETVNWQIRNLLYDHREEERQYFKTAILEGAIRPEDLDVRFLRGSAMQGRILGGNIRCFLKLAGTEYWPDLNGSILLLESWGGGARQMTTSLEQLKQMGVFEQINGILLGVFTRMEEDQIEPSMPELALSMTPEDLPVAQTRFIGHNTDARAAVLGRMYQFGEA